MVLKWASAISADWPSVNGAGGNTSSAEAPPAWACAGDPRRLQAAVRPDAVNDRQFAADFLAGDLHDAALFVRACTRRLRWSER